jgi:hypothetical protein
MTDVTATDEAPAPSVYLIPAGRLNEAEQAIAKANRKLNRHNISGEFTYTYAQKLITFTTPSGVDIQKQMLELTLNTPVLRLAGWEFIATLVHEEAGVIARVVPGRSLDRTGDGWAPDTEPVCDHCHTSRRRRDTYVVRHVETGETKQVGSNCLEAFLGVKPTGLWLLMFEPLEDLREDDDESYGGGGGFGDCRVPIHEIIRYSLAASNFGTGFVSRSAATLQGSVATVDTARTMMFSRLTQKERQELAAAFGRLNQVTAEQVEQVIEAGRAITGNGDYADNMRIALAGERVDYRNMGLVASAISVWLRAQEAQAERETQKVVAGFLAEVGVRIRDVDATVTFLRHRDGYMPGSTETIIGLRTLDGHKVKWFASGYHEYSIGAQVLIQAATVKKHDHWKGQDETVITRAKLTQPDEPSEVDAGAGHTASAGQQPAMNLQRTS